MTLETLIILAQFVAALGVISSVAYLAIQVRQNAKITKAQFGHSLTSRLYERYFLAAKDQEFSRFLRKTGPRMNSKTTSTGASPCGSIPAWSIFLTPTISTSMGW
jgi:hypothetical protein